MAQNYGSLDFEAKGDELIRKLVPDLKNISEDFRRNYDVKWARFNNLYRAYIDMARRDPNRINYFAPYPFADIETDSAQDAKILLGSRPYFPWEPEGEIYRPNVDALSTYLDKFLDWDTFFTTGLRFLKGLRVNGTWYLEPYWDVRNRKAKIGGQEFEYVEERLRVRDIAPWCVGVDPYAAEIDDMRWLYELRAISKTDLKRFMERDESYKIKFKDLKPQKEYGDVGNWFLDRLNYGRSYHDADMCIIMRLWMPQLQRSLQILDGEQILKDEFGVDCPLVVGRNLIDPFSAQHYGVSDLEPVERTYHLINDSYEHIMNTQQQQLEKIVLYREGYIDPDNLIATGGARIPVTAPISEEVFKEIPSSPLSRDAYEIPDRLKNIKDEVLAKSAYNTGSEPKGGKETAFGVRQITEAGDARMGCKIQTVELDAFKRFALKCFDAIEANSTPELEQAIIGKKADLIIHRRPQDFPGGYKWTPRGSSIMSGAVEDQNERLAVFGSVGQMTANPQAFVKTIIKNTKSLSVEEAEEINTAPMQQPQAMMPTQPGQPQPTQQPIMGNELPQGTSTITAGGGGQ